MISKKAAASIPSPWGTFDLLAYAETEEERMPHLAFVAAGALDEAAREGLVAVRIHSECLTGDIFGSRRCDCGEQLHASLEFLAKNKGILIYLRQEGRGIGLIQKLRAYNLQDTGLNTAEANTHLGFEVDARQYGAAEAILKDLGISAIRLLTNNPEKVRAFDHSAIQVVERIPLIIPSRLENEEYLRTKKELMGHFF